MRDDGFSNFVLGFEAWVLVKVRREHQTDREKVKSPVRKSTMDLVRFEEGSTVNRPFRGLLSSREQGFEDKQIRASSCSNLLPPEPRKHESEEGGGGGLAGESERVKRGGGHRLPPSRRKEE